MPRARASKPKSTKVRGKKKPALNPAEGSIQHNQIPAGGTIQSNSSSKRTQKVPKGTLLHVQEPVSTPNNQQFQERAPAGIPPENSTHLRRSPKTEGESNFLTNIKQINLQKKKSACKTYFKELKCNDIMLCQEPYTHKNKMPFVPTTHRSFFAYDKNGNARAAIITPRDFGSKSFILAGFSNRDMITVKYNQQIGGSKIIFCSIYMAHEPNKPDIEPETRNKLIDLVEHAKNNNTNLVIGTDCNGHHHLWNSHKTSPRGTRVAELINQLELTILNERNTPTFINTRGHSSIIDITLTNPSFSSNILNWRVSESSSLSDHKMITYNMNLGNIKKSLKTNFNNFNPEAYKNEVKRLLDGHPFKKKIITGSSGIRPLTRNMDHINNTLIRALDKTCPPTETTHKSKCPWSKTLTKMKKNVKKAKNKAIATKNDPEENAIARHSLAATELEYKNEIEKTEKISFRNYCTSIKSQQKLARIPKKNKNFWEELNTLTKKDGKLTCSSEETLEVLMDAHFPKPTIPQQNQPNLDQSDEDIVDKIINPKKLAKIVSKLQNGKTPGPDNIRNEMIKAVWDHIEAPIIHIFNQCLEHSSIPDQWKTAKAAIIPKPNKDDYTNPRAFRIISLTSNIQKLLEKTILAYLEESVRIDHKLTKNQFGFRRKKGTEAAIHKLTRRIEDAMQNGQVALGIFLDVEGAFDSIKFESIHKGLLKAKIPPTIINWIHAMLTDREIILEIHGVSLKRKIWKGCPQGGILSPLLWNITLNSLLLDSRLDIDFIQAFADDLCILIQGTDLNLSMRDIASKYIKIIDNWCTENGVKLSTVKTQSIIFSNINKKYTFKPINSKDGPIAVEKSVKYLGVTFDRHLRFDEHIKNKCAAAIKAIYMMRNFVGLTWGINPKRSRWIYRQVILPALSYCCFVWIHRSDESVSINKLLQRAQKQANLLITGGFKTTPNITLDLLAGNSPITIHLNSEAIKTVSRLKTNESWVKCQLHRKNRSHASLLDQKVRKIESIDTVPNDLTCSTGFSNQYEYQHESLTNMNDRNSIQIFTDGSVLTDLNGNKSAGAGFAAYIQSEIINKTAIPLGSKTTINQAEMIAIHDAALWLLNSVYKTNQALKIIFLSDSLTTIQKLTNNTSDRL